jgi:outer membrane protein OmpA-like peptidoglycan-associated protein
VVTQSENVKTPPVSFELGTDLAKLYAINPIYFDVNRAIIRPDAALELDKIAAIMNEHPELEIELGSHTDCRSTASYNQSLSNRRAKASAAYVKARIKHPERIKGKGYGESQLLNNCFCEDTIESTCSDEEHQLNRRTEFKIVGLNGEKKGKNAPVDTTTNATTLVKLPKVVKKPIKTNARLKDSIPTVYPAGFEVGADLTKLLQINMIYFDLDKYNIRPEAALELDKIVAVMKQYPNMKIELTSHTDCRMPTDYNQRLSNNRARTSKSYLVAHGIKSARIVGKGLGETQLVVNCPCEGEESSLCTEEQHQLNRRTEFIILSL